jgi:hypothetical protein
VAHLIINHIDKLCITLYSGFAAEAAGFEAILAGLRQSARGDDDRWRT